MKRSLRSVAAVTAVVMLLASCGKSAEDDNSEIDITAEIFSSQAETTAAAEPEPEESEEESSQEAEESEEGSEEEVEESSEEEAQNEEETPEESEAPEEPEPEEETGSGSYTVYSGVGYTFQTDNALWFNEQERMAQIREEAARQAEEMGLDVSITDDDGNNAFDAIYSYVPDAAQPYVSNFNVTVAYIGTNDVNMFELKNELDSYYNKMEDFELLSSEISSFNGREALKTILISSGLKIASYTLVCNNYMYTITMSSTVDGFDKVNADFNDVIATFNFG